MKKWVILLFCTGIMSQEPADADPFQQQLEKLIDTHKRILATRATVNSLGEGFQASEKTLWPEVSLTALQGHEHRNNAEGTANTGLAISEFDVTVTQPVDVWSVKRNAIRISSLQFQQGQLNLQQTIQSVLLEAITATVGLRTAVVVENYARTSVINIKNQAHLENAKVEKGAGLSTDVLQAKIQLAGAEARLSLSKGALSRAVNRYESVFGYAPPDYSNLPLIEAPLEKLPQSIDECVRLALENNFQIQTLRSGEQLAKTSMRQTRSSAFRPDVNLIVDSKFKNNISGIRGDTNEWVAKLEMKYNFNVAGAAMNNYNASQQNYLASSNQLQDATAIVEEQAKNTFEQFEVARENAGFLENQANIAGEFLALAREERQLGRRSLIDVLSGETAEINALSDAEAAKTQVTISAYTLLLILGDLSLQSINSTTMMVN